MNKTYNHKQNNSQRFSTSSSKGCHPSISENISTPWITERRVQSDVYAHWVHEFLPPDRSIACRSEEPRRPRAQKYHSHQCTNKALRISEKATTKSNKSESNSYMKEQERSFSAVSVHSSAKQISAAVPDLHTPTIAVGSYRHRSFNAVDEPVLGHEATLPLTAGAKSKKTPSFLQKMGLKLKRTVEYIGASNCAFEDD